MAPIILPPPTHPSWDRAKVIALRLHTLGAGNPMIVAAVSNGYAEAAWRPDVVGDHGQSFGPWQIKWQFYGPAILTHVGVDIRSEADLGKHVDAVLFALGYGANAPILASLKSATTGAEATAIWCSQFERASAAGAVERRAAIAPQIEVWLSRVLAPDP